MIENFWDIVSKYVGIENAILIALNGYFLFLIVFYRRENNTVWQDFQGSDRILIGGLMGLVLHFLFIMPLSVYIDSILFLLPKDIRELYRIYEYAGLTTQFVSSIIVFAPLIFLRRNTYLFSQKGSEAIKTSIIKYGKIFLYSFLITYTFQISAYISVRVFYTKYVVFNNFWFYITLTNIMFIPFLFFGLYIALTMLVYFDINKTLSDQNIWFKQIFYIDLKKNVFKYAFILIIVFSSVMLFSFADNKLALSTPRYSIKSEEIRGALALHRPINIDDWTLVKRKYSNISITYPLYNHTKYVMIDNPSNIKSKPIFTFNIDNEKITIPDVKNYHTKTILRVDLPVGSSGWENFDARISYDYTIIAPINIYENLTRIESLGNQFYTINYTLLIENNYNETLGSYSTFAGFKLDPRLKRNTTITYYENKSEVGVFTISSNWFYPNIYVKKNSTKKMQWIIKGTS